MYLFVKKVLTINIMCTCYWNCNELFDGVGSSYMFIHLQIYFYLFIYFENGSPLSKYISGVIGVIGQKNYFRDKNKPFLIIATQSLLELPNFTF